MAPKRNRKARSSHKVRDSRPNPFPFNSPNSLVYAVSLVLFVATYYRIHYGIDFSDEGQALGWLYGPMIGYTPFVNDLFFQQTGSLLFTPLFYIWHKLMGSEGVVLFGRHVFILLSLGASFCVYTFSKRFLSTPLAVLVAAATYSYVPFSFASLYYNNIAYLCFLSALFFGARALMEGSKNKFFLTGILFGLGVFSYPTLIIPAAAFYIGTYWYLKGKDMPSTPLLANLTLGGFIPCFLGGLLLLSFGIENLKASLEFSKTFNTFGGLEKVHHIGRQYAQWFPDFWKFAALVALGWAGQHFRWFSFAWILVLFPLVIVSGSSNALGYEFFTRSQYLAIFYLSTVAPLLLYLSFKKRFHSELALIVSASLAGGLAMGWGSGNGLPNAGVGFYPGVIATIIFFTLEIRNNKTPFKFGTKRSALFVFLFCTSLGGSVLYSNYTYMYRDAVVADLDIRIKSGPFAGLITTAHRARFIWQVQKDVNEFSKGRESIFFYDHFPSGYLFSGLKPMCKSLFMHHDRLQLRQKLYIPFYQNEANLPDVVFEFFGFEFRKGYYWIFNPPDENPRGDPFKNFFAKRADYQVVKKRQFYRVLVRRNDNQVSAFRTKPDLL